jgi:integrase
LTVAHIEKRGPNRWRARFREPGGRERSQTFPTKRDAERFLVRMEHSKNVGGYVDPQAGKQLFGDYATAWQKMQVFRATTAELFEGHLARHIMPTFGDRPLARVQPSDVQAWVRKLSLSLAPTTVEVIYRQLSMIFKAAVRDGLIVLSPCREIRLPRIERKQIVPLTAEQVQALIDAAPQHLRALLVTVAGSGLRQGEAFGLTTDHVDFLRRTIRVEQQLISLQGRAPYAAPPKTAASYRTVPVPQLVIDALAEHMTNHPPNAAGLLFTTRDRQPWTRKRFGETWRPAVARAHLLTGTRFHELRHFYASLLIRHGESVKTVQARLGHASAVETLNTYGHLWPDADDRTRDAVDAVLRNVARPARGLDTP